MGSVAVELCWSGRAATINGGGIGGSGEISRSLATRNERGRITRLSFSGVECFSVVRGLKRLTVTALPRIAPPEMSLFEEVSRLSCCDVGVDTKFGLSKVRFSDDGLHEVDVLVVLSSENDETS